MPAYSDCIQLIDSLGDADPKRGILLVSRTFKESFHSYQELHRRIRALAHQFHSQGVRQGQKILIALSTEVDSVCAFLALVYLGAVPFSVPSPLVSQDREVHRRRIIDLITLHGVDRILASEDLAGIVGASSQIPMEKGLALRDPLPRAGTDPAVETGSVAPGDVVFVQFSSGSTSHPKGVQITHRNLLHNLSLIVENDRRSEESVMVAWLPLYHDMGLVGCLLSNLVFKNHLVLMDPLCFMTRPASWLAAISKARGTVTTVPNFALDICTDRVADEILRQHSVDLSSLRYVYNGSEPVRPKTIRRFEEKFEKHGFVPGSIYPVYGMSETTLIITAPKYEESVVVRRIEDIEVTSAGYPLGNFQVRIRDDGGRALEPGQVGEIWVHGSSVTSGYLTPSGNDVGPDEEGWLATGDLGLLDHEGRLFISGRKKDLIIYHGRNFYGHDIASAIEGLPRVRKGKVVVFQIDIDEEEKVVVMMSHPKGRPLDLEEFKIEVRRFVLREFGLPIHDVHTVKRFPKTTSGKVARHRCVEIYLDSG